MSMALTLLEVKVIAYIHATSLEQVKMIGLAVKKKFIKMNLRTDLSDKASQLRVQS